MNSIQSWKDSIKFFYGDNLKPFLMVTVKTVTDVYRHMNHPLTSRGNWLLAIALIILIVLTNVINFCRLMWLEALMLNIILYVIYFMLCLAMRPSVHIKDKSYYVRYITRYWYLLLLGIILSNSYIFVIPFTFLLYLFFLLFALDSNGSPKAVVRAGRNAVVMLYYNAPITIALYVTLSILTLILQSLVFFSWGLWGGLTIACILYLIFVPIEVALVSNVYIKRLHDQPQLYFGR